MASTQKLEFPGSGDLLSQIRFESDKGKIWLNEQRMLMVHASVMGLLRKELIETLGIERAKGFLMRFGYHSGWKDAELVAKVRPDMTWQDAFFVGPQLHCIKGMVAVKPVALEIDMESGHFRGFGLKRGPSPGRFSRGRASSSAPRGGRSFWMR